MSAPDYSELLEKVANSKKFTLENEIAHRVHEIVDLKANTNVLKNNIKLHLSDILDAVAMLEEGDPKIELLYRLIRSRVKMIKQLCS
jgi:hypothetical protein